MSDTSYVIPDTRDTSHGWIFEAYGTAGKNHCEVQALSGDIPGVNPGCREGVSHAHNPQASIICAFRGHTWF